MKIIIYIGFYSLLQNWIKSRTNLKFRFHNIKFKYIGESLENWTVIEVAKHYILLKFWHKELNKNKYQMNLVTNKIVC